MQIQTAPVVSYQQPYVTPVVAPTRPFSVKATRGLGITQVVLGALCVIVGIANVAALTDYWTSNVGFGIWGGVWIIIGGALGIASASNPTGTGLNGTNMAFAIVSSCISFLDIIFYSIAVSYYSYYQTCYYSGGYYYYRTCYGKSNATGVALSAILLFLMLSEFTISITVAIFCCKHGCDCCTSHAPGMIVQTGQPHTVVLQSSGVAVAPQPMISYTGVVSQQYGQPQMQMGYSSPAYVQTTNPTAMTYAQQPQMQQPPMQQPPMQQQTGEQPPAYAMK